jgi:type 1 glutamine amidotransferase
MKVRLVAAILSLCAVFSSVRAADEVKPLKALLVLGGCCHDYNKQKDILKAGIEARCNAEVTIAYEADKGTKKLNPVYENAEWAKGFDVIIHDECAADVKEIETINKILKPHREGLPGVNLHCAMHCYRSEGFPNKTLWFDYTGLATTGHGPQLPIAIKFVDTEHPVVKGALADWTTINEELYNNVKVLETSHALAKGTQKIKQKEGPDKDVETVITWTNEYGEKKTRVFNTTIGHNNATVDDPKYLDMVARGLLWSCDKLNDKYLKAQTK